MKKTTRGKLMISAGILFIFSGLLTMNDSGVIAGCLLTVGASLSTVGGILISRKEKS